MANSTGLDIHFDTRRDFVVDLDDVYKVIGFTRKDNAKTLLTKHLQLGTDYSSCQRRSSDSSQLVDVITMTIRGFKQLCMTTITRHRAVACKNNFKSQGSPLHGAIASPQSPHEWSQL
jgi:hypothetical protein